MAKPWDQDEAMRMRLAGAKLKEIGRKFGVSEGTAHCRLDPDYRARRNAGIRLARQIRRSSRREYIRQPTNYIEYVPSVPNDTRGLTASFFGDPLPGRSALDSRTPHQERQQP